jgi:hypothetical protein
MLEYCLAVLSYCAIYYGRHRKLSRGSQCEHKSFACGDQSRTILNISHEFATAKTLLGGSSIISEQGNLSPVLVRAAQSDRSTKTRQSLRYKSDRNSPQRMHFVTAISEISSGP